MAIPDRLGPYRIEKRLGKGGMGQVYAAVHDETAERAALKVLSPELALAEGFRERFEGEIESLRMLRHSGIVELFGYGEDSGSHFYAMELVDGASLDEELRAGRRFNWREVTQIAIQVCRALKHAHDHGVVHRDIKPANILLGENDRVKLADFGIARLFGSTQLTTAGGILGTADYMSPEQADGRPVTDRCDQYSLGCVMYTLLAGRPPFRAKSLPEMLQLQRFAEAEPVRRHAPQTPVALEKAVGQMLAKTPADRFPNTLVLARHLEAMLRALSKPAEDDFHLTDGDRQATDQPVVGMTITQVESPATGLVNESLAGADDAPADAADIRSMPTGVAPAGDSDGQDLSGGPVAREEPPTATRKFTVVDPHADASRSTVSLPGLAQALLFLLLVAPLAGGAYYLLMPTSANTLYTRILEATAESSDLWDADLEQDVQEFLGRFPDDPRAANLEPLLRQIEASRLGKRLRAAALRGDRDLSRFPPEQQLYIIAYRRGRSNPAAACKRFESLVHLLEPASGDDPGTNELLMLARNQCERLKEEAEQAAAHHLPFAEARLETARRLRESEPERAQAICRALEQAYGNRPWANDLVEEALTLRIEIEAAGVAASER